MSGENLKLRVQRTLDVAAILAAIATVPLIIHADQYPADPLVVVGDWTLWSVFLIQFVFMFAISRDRFAYTRSNWLLLIVIILSFPVLPNLLTLSRLTRLARLLRLVMVLFLGLRTLRRILGRPGFVYVGAVAMFLILTGGAVLSLLEGESVHGKFFEAVWWAIVTVTTVGYGDIAPTTLWGRVVGVALMITGLGVISTLAASVSAYFVAQDGDDEFKEIKARLERIEALLRKRVSEDASQRDEKIANSVD